MSYALIARWRPMLRVLGLSLLVLVLACALSDTVKLRELFHGQDKLEHFSAFAALGFLFAVGASLRGWISAALVLALAAAAIEFGQAAFTVTREAGAADAYASLAGAAFGLIAAIGLHLATQKPAPLQRTSLTVRTV